MIKKISQLDPLPLCCYSGVDFSDLYGDLNSEDEDKVLKRNKIDNLLYEVSYLDPGEHDEVLYYTSYNVTLSTLAHFLGVDKMKEFLSTLAGETLCIEKDIFVGVPGEADTCISSNDVEHERYPDIEHGLSVFSKSEFHNTTMFHNSTEFHETASFFKVINGIALRAQWGDLAEEYFVDNDYEPGTILQFGGTEEMTIATTQANAVVSTKPGLILNSDGREKEKKIALVALTGKVPVKVLGIVKKFDKITLSHVPGIGIVKRPYMENLPTIGVALENSDDPNVKSILCTVKMTLD